MTIKQKALRKFLYGFKDSENITATNYIWSWMWFYSKGEL